MIAPSDDNAMASAIGVVLVLALAVTLFSQVALRDVPEWGATAEREWAGDVQRSLASLGTGAAGAIGTASPVRSTVPAPQAAESFEVPLLGALKPVSPEGTVAFAPACAAFSAVHTPVGASTPVTDLADASQGCLSFEASPAYERPFAYHYELGGLLRVESGRAVVIAGPALKLGGDATSGYDVALALPSLRGAATAASVSGSGVRVDLSPYASSLDEVRDVNADALTWTLTTQHPLAWGRWYASAFHAAGIAADVGCPLLEDCDIPSGTQGTVTISLTGPSRLAISHGAFEVSLR